MTHRGQLLEDMGPPAIAIADRMLDSVSEQRTWWRKSSSGLGSAPRGPDAVDGYGQA